MKVKVGDTVYSGNDQPIMVILTDKDKENIRNMEDTATKYCSFPSDMSVSDIMIWMETEEDDAN